MQDDSFIDSTTRLPPALTNPCHSHHPYMRQLLPKHRTLRTPSSSWEHVVMRPSRTIARTKAPKTIELRVPSSLITAHRFQVPEILPTLKKASILIARDKLPAIWQRSRIHSNSWNDIECPRVRRKPKSTVKFVAQPLERRRRVSGKTACTKQCPTPA